MNHHFPKENFQKEDYHIASFLELLHIYVADTERLFIERDRAAFDRLEQITQNAKFINELMVQLPSDQKTFLASIFSDHHPSSLSPDVAAALMARSRSLSQESPQKMIAPIVSLAPPECAAASYDEGVISQPQPAAPFHFFRSMSPLFESYLGHMAQTLRSHNIEAEQKDYCHQEQINDLSFDENVKILCSFRHYLQILIQSYTSTVYADLVQKIHPKQFETLYLLDIFFKNNDLWAITEVINMFHLDEKKYHLIVFLFKQFDDYQIAQPQSLHLYSEILKCDCGQLELLAHILENKDYCKFLKSACSIAPLLSTYQSIVEMSALEQQQQQDILQLLQCLYHQAPAVLSDLKIDMINKMINIDASMLMKLLNTISLTAIIQKLEIRHVELLLQSSSHNIISIDGILSLLLKADYPSYDFITIEHFESWLSSSEGELDATASMLECYYKTDWQSPDYKEPQEIIRVLLRSPSQTANMRSIFELICLIVDENEGQEDAHELEHCFFYFLKENAVTKNTKFLAYLAYEQLKMPHQNILEFILRGSHIEEKTKIFHYLLKLQTVQLSFRHDDHNADSNHTLKNLLQLLLETSDVTFLTHILGTLQLFEKNLKTLKSIDNTDFIIDILTHPHIFHAIASVVSKIYHPLMPDKKDYRHHLIADGSVMHLIEELGSFISFIPISDFKDVYQGHKTMADVVPVILNKFMPERALHAIYSSSLECANQSAYIQDTDSAMTLKMLRDYREGQYSAPATEQSVANYQMRCLYIKKFVEILKGQPQHIRWVEKYCQVFYQDATKQQPYPFEYLSLMLKMHTTNITESMIPVINLYLFKNIISPAVVCDSVFRASKIAEIIKSSYNNTTPECVLYMSENTLLIIAQKELSDLSTLTGFRLGAFSNTYEQLNSLRRTMAHYQPIMIPQTSREHSSEIVREGKEPDNQNAYSQKKL